MCFNKNLTLLFSALVLLILTGCAKTVTDQSPSLFMTIQIEVNDTLSLNDSNNYYIIFSNTQEVKMPDITTIQNQNNSLYFPTPGLQYSSDFLNENISQYKTLNAFYTNFFNSWTNYILINGKNAVSRADFYSADQNKNLMPYFVLSNNINNHYNYEKKVSFLENTDYFITIDKNMLIFKFNVIHLSNTTQLDDIISQYIYIQILTSKIQSPNFDQDKTGFVIDRLSEAIKIKLAAQERQESYGSSPIIFKNENKILQINSCTITIE